MTPIIPGKLYLGPAKPIRMLRHQGIRFVVNFAKRSFDGRRRHFPIRDGFENPATLLSAVMLIRRRIKAGAVPLYIHCYAGRNRSPMLAALYLACYHRRRFPTLTHALRFIRKIHRQTDIVPGLRESGTLAWKLSALHRRIMDV